MPARNPAPASPGIRGRYLSGTIAPRPAAGDELLGMAPSVARLIGSVTRTALLALSLATPVASLHAQAAVRPVAEDPWRIVPPLQSSIVFARDGSYIGEIGREWRTSVSLRTLPKYVPQAFIAVEDQRFYQHDGVDLVGVAGALKDALRGRVRGASTITQLLVGNMHPDVIDRSDRTIGRKLREQQAAREMERHYTKDQILEAFLNQLHFGRRYYGIESAARHYFGKPAARLTLAEAASLAAMPKGPSIYDPVRYPARNKTRRNTVLALMAQQGFVTDAQSQAAQREPLTTVTDEGFSAPAPWFIDVVRVQAARNNVAIGEQAYRIYTTLDPVLQRAAVEALTEGVADVEARPGYRVPKAGAGKDSTTLQGAIVAMDPFTGDVRALVGGRDYARSPFNRAVNGMRQPGSAFKPIVYATAVSDSLAANEIVADTAIAIQMSSRVTYRPKNSDGEFLGNITLREALTRSRNPVAVQLATRYTMDSVIAMARALGINSAIAPYPSSAIGASVVQPLDLVAAYAAFDNLGARVEARFITRVEDANGGVVWQNRITPPVMALDPRVAFIVRDMMRDVVDRGTATAIRKFVPASIPVAGKTGTTDDNTDVWFVGMTPDLVAGVWLGFDRPSSIAPGAAGGVLAAPIFGRMIQLAGVSRGANSPWTPPAGLVIAEIDRTTGALADPFTPADRRYTEYFIDGTEPAVLRMDVMRILKGGTIIF
ncbi:MAG: PBP1A family penicillin-binding protein [Cytophagaceae bacterium]|nr:PBP1A family penicillin-binding protein [Gemmatimonadaceae bacterium]